MFRKLIKISAWLYSVYNITVDTGTDLGLNFVEGHYSKEQKNNMELKIIKVSLN